MSQNWSARNRDNKNVVLRDIESDTQPHYQPSQQVWILTRGTSLLALPPSFDLLHVMDFIYNRMPGLVIKSWQLLFPSHLNDDIRK
jgi:hypothetical protein